MPYILFFYSLNIFRESMTPYLYFLCIRAAWVPQTNTSCRFETTSTSLSYVTFVLAKHQDVQEKVREEVMETLSNSVSKLYTFESQYPLLRLLYIHNNGVAEGYPKPKFLLRFTWEGAKKLVSGFCLAHSKRFIGRCWSYTSSMLNQLFKYICLFCSCYSTRRW